MSSLPAAQELFDAIRDDLGDPPFVVLDGVPGPRSARAAAEKLSRHPRGGLVAAVMADHAAASLITVSLKRMVGEEFVDVRSVPVKEGTLILAEVPPRPKPRSRSRVAEARAARAMLDFDSAELRPVLGATMQELDDDAFADLNLRGVPVEGLSTRFGVLGRRMLAVGVAVERGRDFVPTPAGLLVFGHRPELFMPGARLVVNVNGEEAEFTGRAREMVRSALRWKPLTRAMGKELVGPLLVNAIAHRDWSAEAEEQPILVTRRGSRLEVSHPGSISRGAPHNPALLSLLVRVGLARGEGSGMRHINETMKGLAGRPMSLAGRGGTVVAVLEMPWRDYAAEDAAEARAMASRVVGGAEGSGRLPPAEPVTVSTAAPETVSPPAVQVLSPPAPPPPVVVMQPTVAEPPPPAPAPPKPPRAPRQYRSAEARQAELLDHLRTHGKRSTREIVDELGWSRATTRAVLAALVDEGLVETTAASQNAPYQAYEACES
jgi:hypothetical protein